MFKRSDHVLLLDSGTNKHEHGYFHFVKILLAIYFSRLGLAVIFP